jgi:hypothetical protein
MQLCERLPGAPAAGGEFGAPARHGTLNMGLFLGIQRQTGFDGADVDAGGWSKPLAKTIGNELSGGSRAPILVPATH